MITNARVKRVEGDNNVSGVVLDGSSIPTDVLIVAAGVEPVL